MAQIKMPESITIISELSEDGWWVAEIAEFPGAISQGRTRDEARDNVVDALSELMAARREIALKAASTDVSIETLPFAS